MNSPNEAADQLEVMVVAEVVIEDVLEWKVRPKRVFKRERVYIVGQMVD